jgi:ribonucleoside-diphosphate reductase alpha subunit
MYRYVINRSGQSVKVDETRIRNRLEWVAAKCDLRDAKEIIDYVFHETVQNLTSKIRTTDLDRIACEHACVRSKESPDYLDFAKVLMISNLQKNVTFSYSEATMKMNNNVDKLGMPMPLLSKEYFRYVMEHADELDAMIDSERDYNLNYIGFTTLEQTYLQKVRMPVNLSEMQPAETPQYLFMRVAVALNCHSTNPLKKIKDTYDALSTLQYTHATPTLLNAGLTFPQYCSCFLTVIADSSYGITKSYANEAEISKRGGGLGSSCNRIRAEGSQIISTNGAASGPVRCAQGSNEIVRHFDQAGKRPGSVANYIHVDHANMMDIIQMRVGTGDQSKKAHGATTGLFVNDLFLLRAQNKELWSLFDPNKVFRKTRKRLEDVWGQEYKDFYEECERLKLYDRQICAYSLLQLISKTQIQSGTPYIHNKDTINAFNPQMNLGAIVASNLCAEIALYHSPTEYACCVLASVAYQRMVSARVLANGQSINVFDHKKLAEVTMVAVENLNNVIDLTLYPVWETKWSNMQHRPVALGIQGLYEVSELLKAPYDSAEMRTINREAMETVYYAALSRSCELAREIHMQHRKTVAESAGGAQIQVGWTLSPRVGYFTVDDVEFELNDYATYGFASLDKARETARMVQDIVPLYKFYATVDDIPTTSGAYQSFVGSPASYGVLQFDFYGVTDPHDDQAPYKMPPPLGNNKRIVEVDPDGILHRKLSGRYDWKSLRQKIMKFGLRNSTMLALMPTTSTSNILGSTECFEPKMELIYQRNTKAGKFIDYSKTMMKELIGLGAWTPDTRELVLQKQSLKEVKGLPKYMSDLYKPAWEISVRAMLIMSAERQWFICQTQSLNIFKKDATIGDMNGIFRLGWKLGLKTLIYYLRAAAPSKPIDYTQTASTEVSAEVYIQNADELDASVSLAQQARQELMQVHDEPVCLGCSG